MSAWSDFLHLTGLRLQTGNLWKPPQVTGKYRGYLVSIEFFTTGYYKARIIWCFKKFVLDLGYRTKGYFLLTPKNLFNRGQITIDEKALNFYAIESQPAGLIMRVLDSNSIKRKLLQEEHLSQLTVNGRELSLCEEGDKATPYELRRSLDLLCDIAEILNDHQEIY